jgi:hypothetical protein
MHHVLYQHRIHFISGLRLRTIMDEKSIHFRFRDQSTSVKQYRWIIERVCQLRTIYPADQQYTSDIQVTCDWEGDS